MKAIFVLFMVVALASATSRWFELSEYTFEDYEVEFRKKYTNEEREVRREIFERKLKEVKLHNQDDTKTWKKGVNQFTDRTDKEFRQHLGLNSALLHSSKYEREQNSFHTEEIIDISALPVNVDWREKGVISAVKDQGQCGSCWTFGTTETIESYWALQYGELTDLSEQEILDCTPNTDQCGGTGGCGGGTPELAYAQIIELGGIASEWQYPYASYFGRAQSCLMNSSSSVATFASITGFTVLASNKYEPVMQHLATVGPLAVNVDASAWSDYESGVFTGCNQTNPAIDHVVQLVGYGDDAVNGLYWLVRNSWSPTYGEEGYIRLARYTNTQCGTDVVPGDGTGCKNGPPQVTVCGECGILYDTSFPIVSTQ